MTRLLPLLAILCLCSFSPFIQHIEPATFVEREPTWTIYEVAEAVTGAPAEILRAIAIVESNERDNAIGDGGESVGRFQFRSKYHAYREAKWGAFDRRDPRASAIVAGLEYADHLARLGSVEKAISAHNTGLHGTMTNGPNMEYVEKVQRFI